MGHILLMGTAKYREQSYRQRFPTQRRVLWTEIPVLLPSSPQQERPPSHSKPNQLTLPKPAVASGFSSP